VWRYLRAAIDLLATLAPDLSQTAARAAKLVHAIIDGTLIPIDRVADQKPYYSGKHKRHGVNVQVLADAAGRLVWASPALPGAVHDLTAARTHGLIEALTSGGVMTFADVPRCWRHCLDAVQTTAEPAAAVQAAAVGQPATHQDPRPRRTRGSHPQDLETAGQAAPRPTPRHRDRRPPTRRRRPLPTMKCPNAYLGPAFPWW
jgi:hypothetical protein